MGPKVNCYAHGVLLSVLLCLAAIATVAPRAEGFIYWTSGPPGGTIGRANPDGIGKDKSFITGASNACGVAVNATHIFWAGPFSPIGRANLDGTGIQPSLISGTNFPCGVAVDGAHVYWANSVGHTIGRANPDGTEVDQSFIATDGFVLWVAVDAGHVYWGNHDSGSIGRASLDGTGVDQGFIAPAAPTGIAVNAEHIYWGDRNAHAIGRASLDGTGVDPSFITGVNSPAGVAVQGAHVYWANHVSDSIGRANLDGTGVTQSLFSADGPVYGIAVDGLSQPLAPNTFSIDKVKRNVRLGTARVTVRVPGPGELALARTTRVEDSVQPVTQAGKAWLLIRVPRFSQAAQRLQATGKVRVRANITYTPDGIAEPKLKSKVLRLVLD